jgi:hypothetical protein
MTSTIEAEASSPASKVTASSSDDDDDNKLDIVVAKNISIGCGSAFTQLAGLIPLRIECGVAGVGDGRSNNSTIGGGLTLITPVSSSSSSSSSHRRPILSLGGHNALSSSSRTRPTNPHSLNFHLRGDTPSIVGDDKKEGGNNITCDESEAVLSNNNNTFLLAVEDEAMCYLCHGTGANESGQPLRRDCACRGTDAGFVHLACLAEYAETKSKQARDMNEFSNPWRTCPSCHQVYQNELAVDIATEFVSFVRRQYPDNTQMQVESLTVKLRASDSMLERLQPMQKREAGATANEVLSLIDRMRTEVSPLPMRYSLFEAFAYTTHGRIAFDEGTEESARRAVAHFERLLQVFEAIGDADGIATAKRNIAIAKSKYDSGNNNEEVLKASQELYELRIAEHGEENEYTIRAGRNYAINLRKANRREEARELLLKLLSTSKRVFGSDHNITKSVESML